MYGNIIISSVADAGIPTSFSESFPKLFSSEQLSLKQWGLDTSINMVMTLGLTKGLGKATKNFNKLLGQKFPNVCKRISGVGSYGASYKSVVTRLTRKNAKKFTIKSIRNGFLSEMADNIFVNPVSGAIDGTREIVGD